MVEVRWSPIELDLDSPEKENTKVQALRILQDANERYDAIEADEWSTKEWRQETFQIEIKELLPYIEKTCSKYVLNEDRTTAYAFGRYLKGTFIIPYSVQ